jgi:hypothetical protein
MMFACHFDKNLFALLLFEGINHSHSQNKSISLERVKLGVGHRIELQQRVGLGVGTK